MRVIADEPVKSALERGLAKVDGTVVLIESGNQLSACAGFDQALEIAESGDPIVMLGWERELEYAKDMRYQACLGYTNVRFARLPQTISAIVEIATTPTNRPADPLALRLLTVGAIEQRLRVLEHNLSSVERDESRKASWMLEVQAILGKGSFEELAAKVRASKSQPLAGELAGESFPDVCFDIEGTILRPTGLPNDEVIEAIRREAQEHPVTIWTGGSVSDYQPLIRKLGITAKVVSKYTMRGATVAKAYDDLTSERFTSMYEVDVTEFVRVENPGFIG